MELLPNFCGGKKSKKCFQKMKTWFYCGFKKRCKISKRRISSTGQKLKSIIVRVAKTQTPQQRGDGSWRGGVSDANMGNTDQVPIYMEDHSNSTWGRRENHERRTVSTAGKEKDRLTVQLTVFKDGRKVRASLFV